MQNIQGMQAAIAIISLTFQAEPHVDDVYLSGQGQVFVPNMINFARGTGRFEFSRPFDLDSTLQSLGASILGDIGSSYNYSVLPSVPLVGEPLGKFPATFWRADDHWEYHYLNSALDILSAGTNYLAVYSDRKVSSSAVCATPEYNSTIDRDQSLIIVNQTSGRDFTFDSVAGGLESNTYGTVPILRQLRTDVCGSRVGCGTGECGPGCSTIHVLEPKSGEAAPGSFDNPESFFFYYECNVTVSSDPPPASDLDSLTFAPMLAAAAAQAIGLNGLTSTDPSAPSSRSFNWELPFGTPFNNSAPDMADQLARYAIGVVAAAASTNPRMAIPGRPPAQGVRLELAEPVAFAVIMGLTAGLQLLLLAVAVILVGRVYVPENQEWMTKETLKQLYSY